MLESSSSTIEDEELWEEDDDSGPHAAGPASRTDPFPCPAEGCDVRRRVHDRRASHPRLGGAGRPEPPAARRAREAGRPQPARRRVRAVASGRAPRTTPGRPPAGRCTAFALSDPIADRMPHRFGQDVPPFALASRRSSSSSTPRRSRRRRSSSRSSASRMLASSPSSSSASSRPTTPVLPRCRRGARRAGAAARGPRGTRVACAVDGRARPARTRSRTARTRRSSRCRATSRCERSSASCLHTQLVCGLHVHVALPDAETALRAFEGVLPWLPVLLALSANSPYAEGEATGLRSTRAERLLAHADRRHAAGPSGLVGVGAGDGGRRDAASLGRLAAAGVTGRSRCGSWTSRPTSAARPASRRSSRH